MPNRCIIVTAAVLTLFPATMPAQAITRLQDDDATAIEDPFRDSSSLEFSLLAGVYLPRLGGTISLGTSSLARDIIVERELDLNDRETVFNGELEIMSPVDHWEIWLTGFAIAGDGSGIFAGDADVGAVELRSGDRFSTSYELASFAFEVAPMSFVLAESERGFARFSPYFGARYLDVDFELHEIGGMRASAREQFGFLYLGAGVRIAYVLPDAVPILRAYELYVNLSGGPALGGDGGSIWQVRGGMNFALSDNVAIHIGYRLIEPSVKDSDFSFDAGVQGLFLGAKITF